jgi:hypothetical protein
MSRRIRVVALAIGLLLFQLPAQAAVSPCTASASVPTSDGVNVTGGGGMNCSGTGRVVAAIVLRVYRQAYGIWSQWGSQQTKGCPDSAYCYRSATWSCNGAGTNNWRTRSTGIDNLSESPSWVYSSVVVLTC